MIRTSTAFSTGICAAVLLTLFATPVEAQKKFWKDGSGGRAKEVAVPSMNGLVEKTIPAVINLDIKYIGKARRSSSEGVGQGSGFLITPDGYALTNNHVIENADEIVVTLSDNRQFAATVVGTDPPSDVALIRLDGARDLPVLPLGDSDSLEAGDWVMAIGSPLGLKQTVTAGLVSAKGRRNIHPGAGQFYSNFIQTDASINPGNSGGPLINMAGEVVGINTAINRLGQGIGFAIPVNMVKSILPRLRSHGFVERSWIGIIIQELDVHLARSFGLDKAEGALVTDVVGGGPAERAGLESGDVILAFDGKPIESSQELPWLASLGGINESVMLTVWRQGRKKRLRLKLARKPNQPARKPRAASKERPVGKTRHFGIEVRDVPPDRGVIVTKILPGSPARSSGLRQGDLIIAVGDKSIDDRDSFHDRLEAARGDVLRLKVKRTGTSYYFAFPTR